MAAGSTYTPIATTTLSSGASSYTFSSIPSTYTDLVIITNGTSTVADDGYYVQMGNGSVDTGYNYSTTYFYGTGSTAASGRESNNNSGMQLGRYGTSNSTSIINIMNYSNSNTYKTCISQGNNPASIVIGYVGLWRSTSVVNTIKLIGTFNTGFTFTLYGILSA